MKQQIRDEILGRLGAPEILNALPDGAYITDTDRNIVFWNGAAERITGWSAGEVVGKSCGDNILVHVDKDGHPLCGKEHCPLHRSIVTASPSAAPVLVYAQGRTGRRVPVEVTVAPIMDAEERVLGGIELFRDMSAGFEDMVRAHRIQRDTMHSSLPEDPRWAFSVQYTPNELVGGDFCRIEKLPDDRYAFMIADVMGHGVASALYTMQLRSLWEDHRAELADPAAFFTACNRRLVALAGQAGYFATALHGCLDAASGRLSYVCAGHPAPLVVSGGATRKLTTPQPALGMVEEMAYATSSADLAPGDSLLLYTDGAVEVNNLIGVELGLDGLAALAVKSIADGEPDIFKIEEGILQYSANISLPDDLTLLLISRRKTA